MSSRPRRVKALPRPTKKGKDRSQEDNLWKEILDEILEPAMSFFFPDYHQDIDWSKGYESLDKEMIEITEEGGLGKQAADKLFRVHWRTGEAVYLLLHIEVQGYKDDNFAERLMNYNFLIHRKYNQPVDSFAILTDGDKNFRPNAYRREHRRNLHLYQFPIVKLLDYWKHIAALEQDPNPFALVVMAHLKTQKLKNRPIELKEAKIQLIRLVLKRGLERDYVVKLLRFIDWMVKLPPPYEADYRVESAQLFEEAKMPYLTTWERYAKAEGIEQGKQEGLHEGLLIVNLTLLEQRFGSIEPELREQLAQLTSEQLQELGKRLLSLSSKANLMAWLEKNAQL